MKNLFSLLLISLLTVGVTSGQDAFKQLKNAEKAFKKFTSNMDSNGDQLTKGMGLLESAFASDEVQAAPKAWVTKGKIYKSIANAEFKAKTLDLTGTYQMKAPNAASEAYDAYKKAYALSPKKNELKEIELGMTELENHLNNYAIVAYQAQDYKSAFSNFSRSIEAYETLKNMGKKSRLEDNDQLLTDQYFFTAVSAYYDKNLEGATPFLEKLHEDGSEEAFVYEALYNINAESNPEKAIGYLESGMEKNPDDTGLLFAQINHYLKDGQLDVLIGKLDKAIEKEPDNASIYTTLASVYDQLHAKEEDEMKSKDYFDKALLNYNTAIEKDPKNFDAQYSIGALYYNKAAGFVDVLNSLASDLSASGMKKYDATKIEMDELFDVALPYFLKAEELNANDGGTMQALKEIYAKKNNLEKANEYKAKMDALGN